MFRTDSNVSCQLPRSSKISRDSNYSTSTSISESGRRSFRKALFSYAKQNEDELSFQKGDEFIPLTERTSTVEDGWIKVQKKNSTSTGFVPRQYITHEEEKPRKISG